MYVKWYSSRKNTIKIFLLKNWKLNKNDIFLDDSSLYSILNGKIYKSKT